MGAPIPHKQKKQVRTTQTNVSTNNVYDEFGRSMTSVISSQKRTNKKQQNDITVARQHARKNESSNNGVIVFRDIFPGMKYKLIISDTTWVSADNTLKVGYYVGEEYTLISEYTSSPENNTIELDLSDVSAVDYLRVDVSTDETIDAYLEDYTETSSILGAITEIVENIAEIVTGLGEIRNNITALQNSVTALQNNYGSIQNSILEIQGDISDLDERVTALENA